MNLPIDHPCHEANEISLEDLEVAADMFDELVNGTFYDDQAEAERWIRQQSCRSSD